MKKNKKLLFITEDFPSGLNGTSVKTKNTLKYLLNKGYKVDVCCFSYSEFNKQVWSHKNLKIHTINTNKYKKLSIEFIIHLFESVFSLVPTTIKRLFSTSLHKKILKLQEQNVYLKVYYDGYSTLQYLNSNTSSEIIYIDDEDFTDLFRQRMILEYNFFKKAFYFQEYFKSILFESRFMKKVDQVWAISPNTKMRLEKVSGVKTSLMPTIIPIKQNLFNKGSSKIVFTGTLNWRENIQGLKWFIDNHWDDVISHIYDAELVVIGQGASKELVSYLKSKKSITYKGYVKSLQDEYSNAALSVAPVRINAGIKVKILTYMSFGLPVVSTKIAALGLVSTNGLLISRDINFSKCIIKLLKNAKLRECLSNKAHQNIRENYSSKKLDLFFSKN